MVTNHPIQHAASVLITGSEILDGRVADTNSHLIIERLTEAGIPVRHTLSCGDDLKALGQSLTFLFSHTDIVILSGGMGPTSDDLTREAASEWAGVALEEREEALNHLRTFYAARGRTFDQSNYKQVLFPHGSDIIPNLNGTAPGFFLQRKDGPRTLSLIALPGVPGELRAMLTETVVPMLWKRVLGGDGAPKLAPQRFMRVFWLPESQVGARVAASGIPNDLVVSYRAAFPEVHVVLKATSIDYDLTRLDHAFKLAQAAVGSDRIITLDPTQSLDMVLHALLEREHCTLSVAESCTGGMIGELMTTMPGSSRSFLGSAVTYSNEAKQELLKVSSQSLKTYGAVSAKVACEMAEGAKTRFGSKVAVSVTGIAGPEGGSEAKPVGTFFIGYASEGPTVAYQCFFSSSRQRIRRFAAITALDIVRRKLSNLTIEWRAATI